MPTVPGGLGGILGWAMDLLGASLTQARCRGACGRWQVVPPVPAGTRRASDLRAGVSMRTMLSPLTGAWCWEPLTPSCLPPPRPRLLLPGASQGSPVRPCDGFPAPAHTCLPLSVVASCDEEQQSALEEARQPKNDNVVVPECAHGGLYKPVQCHLSTGYCWCVLVDTGRPVPGTSTR